MKTRKTAGTELLLVTSVSRENQSEQCRHKYFSRYFVTKSDKGLRGRRRSITEGRKRKMMMKREELECGGAAEQR